MADMMKLESSRLQNYAQNKANDFKNRPSAS